VRAEMPSPAEQSGGTALAAMTEQLVLLSAHADDHLRYCSHEMEALRERFARELQSALDSGARQLQQLARSTMQTTFRSLLEDLAHKAEAAVEENLARLRKALDDSRLEFAKYLDEEAEAAVKKFEERMEKQTRQLNARLEQLEAEGERALDERMQEALADYQGGCAALLRDLLHSIETHKATRTAARRK